MASSATQKRRKRIAPPQRKDAFKRFLFSNGISLLTLLSVVFYAGEYKQRFLALENVVAITSAQAMRIEREVNNGVNRLSVIENELANVKGRYYYERDPKAR